MSTETTIFVRVDITLPEGTEEFPIPEQKLDEGEFVSPMIIFITACAIT